MACLPCDTTDPRIGCTYALIPNRMYVATVSHQCQTTNRVSRFGRAICEVFSDG
ncbi:hypothetical protein COCMIDRAFT_109715 [Bipolaris oryzae ATCC 44560]|uniref:Uncharacterized protein n=1 Tax=Bipolaris oryzae ATCC 44560 TaxID=930090 RepID=W6YRD0_COCMI|nr:uncharacterized protein COCMIDRAFT_109715 [Bipolaris oryzae ATCC 44560]EUC40073.1 hypothetical protein COCMIDRAFT_109715 [Bipolaris oryzae ATCC 44560]